MASVIDSKGNITPHGERKLASMPPDRAATYLAELRAFTKHNQDPGAWINQIPASLIPAAAHQPTKEVKPHDS